jgi:hypothetical protein
MTRVTAFGVFINCAQYEYPAHSGRMVFTAVPGARVVGFLLGFYSLGFSGWTST